VNIPDLGFGVRSLVEDTVDGNINRDIITQFISLLEDDVVSKMAPRAILQTKRCLS